MIQALALRRAEAAIASEINEVDNSITIAGGVTAANLPQAARKFRCSEATSVSGSAFGVSVSEFFIWESFKTKAAT
jgi:hypothetical protein